MKLKRRCQKPFHACGISPEPKDLLFRQENLKPFAPLLGLGISSDVRPIQRLRNSHSSNSARHFLEWALFLDHAETVT